MKRLFFMAVIGFCGALLALQHLPAMAGATGIKESGPWLLAMIADAVLGVATLIKLVGPEKLAALSEGDDAGFEMSDIVMSDSLFYPVVIGWGGLHILMNGYDAAMSGVSGSIWWGAWVLIDIAICAVAYLFLRHIKAVLARRANNAPRRVA